MKIFDRHFIGAKNHKEDDLLWLLACYYGTIVNLCQEYSYLGDEDLFSLLVEWFWYDFEKFTIFDEEDKIPHKNRKSSYRKKE